MSLVLRIEVDDRKAAQKIKAAAKKAGASVSKFEKDSVRSSTKMQLSFSRLAGIAGIGGVGLAIRALARKLTELETSLA